MLRDVRRPMLAGATGIEAGIFLVSGAVSGVSWYTAFALGLMRELNDRVQAPLLVLLWLGPETRGREFRATDDVPPAQGPGQAPPLFR